MATKKLASSTLQWALVLEVLASLKEVDTSFLLDLVNEAPDVSGDIGKNAREALRVKMLEGLSNKARNVESLPDSKIAFESSERCQDIHRVIYDELKDVLLQGNHPLLAPLKEKSGLDISNESETVNPSDNGNPNGVNKVRLEQRSNSKSQAIAEIIDLTSEDGDIQSPVSGFDILMDLIEAGDYGNQQKVLCTDDNDSQDESGKEKNLNSSLDNSKQNDIVHQANGVKDNCEHNNLIPNMSDKEKADAAYNLEHKISSDTEDGYNDEKTNIASQPTYSPDFLSEMNLCMKCNQTGVLLICSSDACPIVVHENCLGSAPTFDEKGNFYCPFCACSDCWTLKEKASPVKKKIMAFIGSEAENWPRSDKKRSGKDADDIDENNKTNSDIDGNGGVNPSLNVHPKEPLAAPCNKDDDSLCGEKKRKIINKGKKKSGNYIRPRVLEDKGEVEKSYVGPLSNDIGGSSKEENNMKSGALKYFFRTRKRGKQNTFPSFAHMRRKTLCWTKVEIDKLKEGMQKYSNEHDKWKMILEFGMGVFLKGRTAVDLKDKWRNLCWKNP